MYHWDVYNYWKIIQNLRQTIFKLISFLSRWNMHCPVPENSTRPQTSWFRQDYSDASWYPSGTSSDYVCFWWRHSVSLCLLATSLQRNPLTEKWNNLSDFIISDQTLILVNRQYVKLVCKLKNPKKFPVAL